MKRNRESEEEVLIISSDSEDEQQEEESEEDWEEVSDDDTDEEDINGDDDDDEDASEDDNNDDDGSPSDDDSYDDEDDDFEDDDDAQSSDSLQVLGSKVSKSITCGAESAQQGEKWTRQKHKQEKGRGHAKGKTALSTEDQKLFSDALNIIREGDLQKLALEHCKAYLRRYSLRLTGSKSVLLDRVQEHIELKSHGGMAKYPQSTFTINCTGDVCTGDIVLFKQKVKRNYNNPGTSSLFRMGKRIVAGRIVKESYGSDKQQHTFTVEVLWSRGPRQLPFLYPLLIKGRNLYRFRTFRQRWPNEEERKKVLREKHSRGVVARNARECRVSGKEYSCSSRKRIRSSSATVTLRRKSKDITVRERSMTSTSRSSVRDDDKRWHAKCRTLTIKACYAGRLIGTQGRSIGTIERASGAQVRVCDHPSSPSLRMVEIYGSHDQVQVATQMVVESFVSKGLPPPLETT